MTNETGHRSVLPGSGTVSHRDGRRETTALAAAAVIGMILVAVGWIIQGQSYVPGLLLQIGSSFVLVVPLLLLGRLLERRLRQAEERTRSISATLTDMRARLDETATRLEELGTATRQRMAQQQQEDLQAADAVQERLSRASLIDLLERATVAQAVSASGIRTRVPGTALWVRVRSSADGADGNILSYDIEERGGARLATVIWAKDEAPATVARRLAEELITRGAQPGEQGFDASALHRQLLQTIHAGLEHRPGASGERFGPLVELVNDQWAIAIDGLYCLSQPYHIPANRLTGTSEDWRRYMSQKPWVDAGKFSDAYSTAIELYHLPVP